MKLKKILAFVLTLVMLLTSVALILPAAAEKTGNYEAEVLGASIRTVGDQGLRFIGKIRKDDDVHPGEGANFGFLLIPSTMVESTTVWDEENKVNTVTPESITSETNLVKTVPAVKLMRETAVQAVVTNYANDYDEYYYFTAVITNIPATFYGTEILARIYVTANEVTTYSNQISRSVQYVANTINEVGGEVPEFITEVLADFELYGQDIFVDADKFAEEFWATQIDAPEPESTLTGDYKYVAIIGVDGAGAFFQQADTPNIDAIFADGAVTYTAKTENPSSSGPCWGSLLHGVAPEVHGVDNSNINSAYPYNSAYPSIFRVIREADANVKLASFAQWGEINVGLIENGFGVTKVTVPTATPGIHTDEDGNQYYADSNGKIDYVYKDSNGTVCLNYRDILNKNMICDYLDEQIPTLLFVQFGGPDYAGEHGGVSWAGGSSNNQFNGGWGGFGSTPYLQQITITDGYIGEIYAKYEAAGVLEDTLFIVTADHGGVNYGHGGSSDAEMNIMFAISGKTIKSDCAFENMRIRDTAAIVAEALGVTAPNTWAAKVPEDLFETPEPTISGSFGAYKYVAVIGIDGAGRFFQNTSTPNIDSIFAGGATTYSCLTPVSISAQSWGSMLHGVTANYHKLTNATIEDSSYRYPTDSQFPSIFRVLHEADPTAKMASIVGWDPINTGIVEDGLGVRMTKQSTGSDDALVRDRVCAYLDEQIPTLLFVQFDQVDLVGHNSGWGGSAFLNQITTDDGYIGEIFAKYQAAGALDDTLFILTADHGGSGNGHGGSSDDHVKVLLAVRGKTVVNGTIGEVENRDIAAIVTYALGIQQPSGWTARVPSNLFEDVVAQDRPVPMSNSNARAHTNAATPANLPSLSKSLYLYLPLDNGSVADASGNNRTTSANGHIYFGDDNGYYGGAAALDDGYISVSNYYPGTNDFSISFWINTYGTTGDPAILSNKDWASGTNSGWVLALHSTRVLFNFGNGSGRRDIGFTLPSDYQDGWVHVIITVNHSANQVKCYYDFAETAPEYDKNGLTLTGTSLTSGSVLNIGQDGLAHEPDNLPGFLDDVMIFNGVLTASDIAALKTYYGK